MNTETDARPQALSEVGATLRRLAANLIDIVRGAGRPLELSRDVDAFAVAIGAFEGVVGEPPKAWEYAAMLRVALEPDHPAPASEEEMAERYAQHVILQGSLQLAAKRLLGQEAEAATAYVELHKALLGLEETKQRIEKRRHDREENVVAQVEAKH